MDDKKNKEGYQDPTAANALDNIFWGKKAEKVMKTMKCTADLAGFEVVGVLQVKCRKTGKVFRSVIEDKRR